MESQVFYCVLPVKRCKVSGKQPVIISGAFILIPLPVLGPSAGASCGSIGRVSNFLLPHRGNYWLCAAIKMTGNGKWNAGGTGARISQMKHRVKCGRTVFNEAGTLQVESWLLTCDRKSGRAGKFSRNEEIFAFS